MIKLLKVILFCFSMLFLQAAIAASPLGYWKTIDDVTGKPKAIIEITQSSNHKLYGKILKIYPTAGNDQNELCIACQGERHNKRIVGMVILEGLTQDQSNQDQWGGGTVLDPKNGKTYRCNLQVSDDDQKLNVRGYIGISAFGRSQTWLRVSGPSANE